MTTVYPFDHSSDKKICQTCQKLLNLSQFHNNGTRIHCKDCVNAKIREKNAKNRGLDIVPLPFSQRNPPGKRFCTRCQQMLDLNKENFYHKKGSPEGFSYICKNCRAKYSSSPKILDKSRQYAREHRPEPEKIRENSIKNYHRHKDRINERRSTKRAADPIFLEKEKAYKRKHYRENTEKWRAYRAERRHAVYVGSVTAEELKIIRQQTTICYICNQPIDNHPTHFDHVIPLFRGGLHEASNIRLTHAICNQRKKTKLISEMTPFQRRGP